MASSISSTSQSTSSSDERRERRKRKERKRSKEREKKRSNSSSGSDSASDERKAKKAKAGERDNKKSKSKDKHSKRKREKEKDKGKKKKHKSSREDTVRSVISGKRIKRQIEESEADVAARQEREMRLRLLNEDEDGAFAKSRTIGEKPPSTMQEFAAARLKAARNDPKLMAQIVEEAQHARKEKRNKVRARAARAGRTYPSGARPLTLSLVPAIAMHSRTRAIHLASRPGAPGAGARTRGHPRHLARARVACIWHATDNTRLTAVHA